MITRTLPRTVRRTATVQAATAHQWRHIYGPGHQFPIMTDRVLGYWPDRR